MTKEPSAAHKMLADFAPKLVELTDDVLFGDVWERPGLSKRDRSLITVAALAALNRPDQLRFHLGRAVENGATKGELVEAITHLAFYAGWPSAMTAIMIARELFSNSESLQPGRHKQEVDFHPSFQQIAMVDSETGEYTERKLTRELAGQFSPPSLL